MNREEVWAKALFTYLPIANSEPMSKADSILEEFDKRFTPSPDEVYVTHTNWDDVLDGCLYENGSIEASLNPDKLWKIVYREGEYSWPVYLPISVTPETAKMWWSEYHESFLEDAMASVQAQKDVM